MKHNKHLPPPSRPAAQIPVALLELAIKERVTPLSLDGMVELLAVLVDDWAELAYAAVPDGPPPGVPRTAYTLMFEHIGTGVRATMLDVVLPTLVGLHNALSTRHNLGRLPITIPGPPNPVDGASPFAQFGIDTVTEAPSSPIIGWFAGCDEPGVVGVQPWPLCAFHEHEIGAGRLWPDIKGVEAGSIGVAGDFVIPDSDPEAQRAFIADNYPDGKP